MTDMETIETLSKIHQYSVWDNFRYKQHVNIHDTIVVTTISI